MEGADLNLACAWALVDGLVAGGVRHACVSPGSRSTSLALALSRHSAVTVHVHLDERSSSFFAVGLARASDSPVAIACTSGTAAAELLPAVVEASQSRVPLVILTADRPARFRGTGANQTIDQVGLYGVYVREDLDLPVPEAAGQEAWWRQAAREALEAQRAETPGPVHINCPFEEPLSPSPDVDLPPPGTETLEQLGRPDADLTPEEADRLSALISEARGALVVGGWTGNLTHDASYWSETLGWPVIAEPGSGIRTAPWALGAGQALLEQPAWAERHRPEVVIQLGAAPTTRATQRFVASSEHLVVADRRHLDPDPERRASWRIAVDPEALRSALDGRPVEQSPAPADWTHAWRDADRRARETMDRFLDELDEPFEPRIARDVAASLPDGGTLFVGNSTPIRDLDLAMTPRDGLRVLANRGASGIDGLVSTALGVAAGADGEPVISLIGDLSFLHDFGAVAWNARRRIDATIVVVRNGGGEVFSLLPQRALPEHRELFVTPHDADLGALTEAAGAAHTLVERAAELVPALAPARRRDGLQVIEVAVDPERSLDRRAALRDAISSAIG
jgi:2-succinyl-5-enolpyruvyl-6-hydroxy-3-cyclohexene-1-carboxylate synthase